MEKERRMKILTVVSLIIAVVFLSVAFAAMSTTLNIKGKTAIEAVSWNIHFDNLTSETKGYGKVIKMPEPSEDGTSLTGFQVSLKKPGDMVKFNYDIVNAGDFDAKVEDVCVNGYCISNPGDVSKLLIFEAADLNGDGETTEEEIQQAREMFTVSIGELDGNFWNLVSGTTGNSYLRIDFTGKSDKLPIGDLILKLDLKYIYVQK